MDGKSFSVSADDIFEFLDFPSEGDATYFENVTWDILFQKYNSYCWIEWTSVEIGSKM